MMISEEQARLAARAMRGNSRPPSAGNEPVSSDLIAAAILAAASAPDLRFERITHARQLLDDGMPDSRVVAEKIISRIVGDSLL